MHLDLLNNQIDITQVPFSDRGSRLAIFQKAGGSRLYVKLAERLTQIDPAPEAYVSRPPFISNLCLIDKNGSALDFRAEASPDRVVLTTRLGPFQLAFQDGATLALGLPSHSTCGICFEVNESHYRAEHDKKAIRFARYSTNAEFLTEECSPTKEGYRVELAIKAQTDSTLALRISNSDAPPAQPAPFSRIQKSAQGRWKSWFDTLPPVAEPYQQSYAYAWWVLANNTISPVGHVAHEAIVPSKAKYIGLWLWDSALHALALRHADPEMARNQIRAFLPRQLPDGMFPDVVFDEGVVSEIDHPIKGRVTKPPILAWAALKIHEIAPDVAFLEEIYDPIVRWNRWWFDQSTDGAEGLASYSHPYSSGLDDNPLWDQGMPVISPELNTYLCLQMQALADIAVAIGREADVPRWKSRSEQLLKRMLAVLWDDATGYFQALHKGQLVPVLTPFHLYPLWTGQLPKEISSHLLEHLQNPESFWGETMLPTVARNDPKHESDVMWRGPVWTNINYFFVEALNRLDERAAATELRRKTLNLVMGAKGIFEYYNAQSGLPPSTAAPMFSWTAATFIDLAIQESKALSMDLPA